jgi:lipopolysaccharide export system permease protein
MGAIALIIVVKAFETTGLRLARGNEALWFATYIPSFVGFIIIWFLLFWAGRPTLFKRPISGATPS